MLGLRRFLFCLFAGLYLVLCPLLILYALGYLVTPWIEPGLTKTGLINLATLPPGATVYVGKRRYTETTPTVLRDLLPGQYPLTVTLTPYKPWHQTVPVEAGRATALDHILLLPRTWRPQHLVPEPCRALIPLPGTRRVLLATGPHLEEYRVYDEAQERHWPLVPKESPFRGMRVLAVHVVPESPRCLVTVEAASGQQWLWITSQGRHEVAVDNLTAVFFPEKFLDVRWEPSESTHLWAVHEGTLHRLDTATKTIRPWADHVRGWGLIRKRLYLLQDDGALLHTDTYGDDWKPVLDDPASARVPAASGSFYQIREFPKEPFLLLWGTRGELLCTRPPYQLVESGVLGLGGDPRRGRLLIWTAHRIGLVTVEEGIPQVTWVYQGGRGLEQAFWVADGSHILLRDRDTLWLLGVDTAGTPHLDELFRVKAGTAIHYSEATGRVYYLDRATGHGCTVELVPQHESTP